MPALWKSIIHREKPGYSSNPKSFEMLGSNQKNSKNSRSINQNRSLHYVNEHDSDENILIPNSKSYVTTQIRAGNDVGADQDSDRGTSSANDAHIVRTVEVRQYEEGK